MFVSESVPESGFELLSSPDSFRQTVSNLASTATARVSFATLYMGSEQLEEEVAGSIIDTAGRLPLGMCRIVVDGARCRRGLPESSETMFARLCKQSQPIALPQGRQLMFGRFCLPHHNWSLLSALGSLLRRPWSLPPAALLESGGVQHSKVYAADEQVLLSGANLSEVYFRRRVDRWVLLKDPGLARAAHAWVEALGKAAGEATVGDSLVSGEGMVAREVV